MMLIGTTDSCVRGYLNWAGDKNIVGTLELLELFRYGMCRVLGLGSKLGVPGLAVYETEVEGVLRSCIDGVWLRVAGRNERNALLEACVHALSMAIERREACG